MDYNLFKKKKYRLPDYLLQNFYTNFKIRFRHYYYAKSMFLTSLI